MITGILITPLAYGVVGLLLGVGITFFIIKVILKTRSDKIIHEAKAEAEVLKKDKVLQAKEKFLQLRSEHEKMINERTNKLVLSENKFKQRESSLFQKIEDNRRKNSEIDAVGDKVNKLHELLPQNIVL